MYLALQGYIQMFCSLDLSTCIIAKSSERLTQVDSWQMEFIAELEAMASLTERCASGDTLNETVERWQLIFGFSESLEGTKIHSYRNDLANKDISPDQWSPTLGIDATLPQHRYDIPTQDTLQPQQEEYPV